jgi:hypothetical protein
MEQIWTCTKREECKLQAIEVKFLRAVAGKIELEKYKDCKICWD